MNSSASPQPTTESTQKNVTGIWLILIASIAAIAFPLVYFVIWPAHVRSVLLQTGIQAEGVITNIEPTGNQINHQPEIKITVDVTPKDGPVFRTNTKQVVNPIFAPSFQPGKRVLVRYDAHDHSKMTIEYTQGSSAQ